ncbi:MAG: M48 family metalloprotease [Alphaproteobacteria bacterium]|nr:M48 family metalloprotease [Alphaproteobacteria bacterium]
MQATKFAAFRLLMRLAPAMLALVMCAPSARAQSAAGWSEWLGSLGQTVDRLSEIAVTPEQERQIAESEHPKILAQFGGEYADPAIKDYVAGLVRALGRASARPELEYRVTVLNSPVVNAFALPAGNIYTTRGLLALAGSEAELAGVLAHEIGHVTARHTAQRYGRSLVVGSGTQLLGWLTGSASLQQAGEAAGMMWIQGFSREQEFQADELGVATMARAGYDPLAMASFLAKLEQQDALQATLAGRTPGRGDAFNLFATHPRTAERVERAIAQAGLAGATEGREEREAYLRRIDGLLYGDDPGQGFVSGRAFVHPTLGFRFEVPDGFQLLNGQAEVTAVGPGGATIRFDNAAEVYGGPMRGYIAERWGREAPLANLEPLAVNGMEGASAVARLNTQGGPVDIRFTAIRFAPDRIYRFQFIAPTQFAAAWGPEFGKVTGSFRRLSRDEARTARPRRVALVRADARDSAQSLAERFAAADHRPERFRALNGLKPDEPVAAGRLYKIVVE